MCGNKMIGTVFFLAIAAPLVAAQYPTTKQSYPTTTPSHSPVRPEPATHQPPSYPGPSHETQAPTSYEPSHTPTGYEPSHTPTGYEPSNTPSDYEPSNTPTDYEPTYSNQGSYRNEYPQGPYHQPVNAPTDVFSNYPSAPVRNIRAEVADAGAQIAALLRSDRVYNTNLDIIESKVNQTTRFREEFENKIYQQLVASITAQDKHIEQYRAQLGDLSNLTEQVKELMKEVNALIGQLQQIRVRQSGIWVVVNKVETISGPEDLVIVAVEDQVDGNDELLEIINATRTSNLARRALLVADLQKVVEVVNEEQAEIYTVTLTAQNKSVHIQYENEFATAPQLVYSIIGIDIVDINEQSSGSGQGGTTNPGYGQGGTTNSGYGQGGTTNPGYGQGGTTNPGYGQGVTTNPGYGQGGTTNKGSGQGGNNRETIFPRVIAQGDAKGVTVSLNDGSVGFRTESVRVRIFAFVINNDQIQRSYY